MQTNSIQDFNQLQLQILKMSQGTSFSELLTGILEFTIKAERNVFLDSLNDPLNKGNGYYQRCFNSIHGKLEINVARDRLGIFKPLVLELAKVEAEKYNQLIVELYSKGVTHVDIQSMMQNIYGCDLSSGQISSITNEVLEDLKAWQSRTLKDEYTSIFIDTTYVKVKRDGNYSSEGFTIVLGWKYDGDREILGIYSTPTESATSWKNILLDIKERGVKQPLIIVSDGLTGFGNVLITVFPKALHQGCIVHLKRNIMSKLKKRHKEEVMSDLYEIFNPHIDLNIEDRLIILKNFLNKRGTIYKDLLRVFSEEKIHHYFAYLTFPKQLRSMIYTTNWIERFNRSIKKKIKIRNGLPSISSVEKLIFFTVLEYQSSVYIHKVTQAIKCKKQLYELRLSRYGKSSCN